MDDQRVDEVMLYVKGEMLRGGYIILMKHISPLR